MAEMMMLVCNDCGEPSADRIVLRSSGLAMQKDLCQPHIDGYFENAEPLRRGRPRVNGVNRKTTQKRKVKA